MPKILGIRISALVEMAVFFMLLLPFAGRDIFADLNPHPFWIIVILCSLQYGVNEGLLAAIISSAILLIGHIPEKPEEQYFWTYIFNLGLLPGMWLVSSLIIGLIRGRQLREKEGLQLELAKSKQREEKIAESYSKVRDIEENLERRLAGEFRSSLSIYKAAQAIETLSPAAVINGISDLINAIMRPEKFSVYLLQGDKLVLTTKFGWNSNGNYAESFSSGSQLYQKIVGEKKLLVISNEEDEATLGGEGYIAGPIIHPNGRIIGMLKIEALDFADFNITSVGSFAALCSWIAMAYANALDHQRAIAEGMISETSLLSEKYFERQVEYLTILAARAGFDATLLVIRIVNGAKLGRVLRNEAERALSQAASRALRRIDQTFQYRPSSSEYSILLAATDEAGAKKVLAKMMDMLDEYMEGNLKKVQFSFSVQSLHRKEKK